MEALAALPEELIKAMRRAVEDGDIDELHTLVDRVREMNREVAEGLQKLVRQYDYAALSSLLSDGDRESGSS